jgi:signal transduction histidine kinase
MSQPPIGRAISIEQRLEAFGREAGEIAHELNNVLTVVLGFSDALLARSDFDDRSRVRLSEIRRAGERAADLSRRLSALSRSSLEAQAVAGDGCPADVDGGDALRSAGSDLGGERGRDGFE